jgi:hypothetical protein
LVRYDRAVHGVGAPVFAYSLTPAGEALFPRSYVSVLATALDALRAEQGTAAVAGVLESEWNRLADEAGPLLAALPLDERMPLEAARCVSRKADPITFAVASSSTPITYSGLLLVLEPAAPINSRCNAMLKSGYTKIGIMIKVIIVLRSRRLSRNSLRHNRESRPFARYSCMFTLPLVRCQRWVGRNGSFR